MYIVSIHQSNIVDTFHYFVNLDDDIAHVSLFVIYISDLRISLFIRQPIPNRHFLSSDREQEKIRRKIPEKDHISPRYIFDRTTTMRGEGDG